MSILTIIVTYNGIEWIERCLQSVKASNYKTDCYIVDNGSIDGTIEYIQNNFPEFFLNISKKNLGFGRANNLGLQYAIDNNYDFVYLLNQDAWIFPDTLETLVRIINENPSYGILSPFQMQADEKHLEPVFGGGVCSRESNEQLLDDMYYNRIQEVYTVPEVQAAHWLIKRDCLICVGGFSTTFPHYGEDNNYQDRVYYHGYKVGIVPSAKAVHDAVPKTAYNKKKQMRMEAYIKPLIKLSNIYNTQETLGFVFAHNIIACLRYGSFIPLKYFFSILFSFNRICKNRKKSISKCAFIRNNCTNSLLE